MRYSKEIIQLAIPAMIENILQMLMGVVDNYLVAQLGVVAVSGVSVANNIITVYQAIFIALGASIASLLAKSLAGSEKDDAILVCSQAIFLTLLIGAVLGIISIVVGQTFFKLLGTTKSVAQVGGLYLAIVGGGVVTLGMLTTLGSFLRVQGQPRLPMYASIFVNFLNAVLSGFAIFEWGYGLVGVAVSTLIARLIGICILAKYLPIKKIIKRMTWKISAQIWNLALPSAGERLMMRAGDVVIVAIVVQLGTNVVAGNAIGETLTQFNYMPGLGIATATIILTAKYVGQKNRESIEETIQSSYYIGLVLMILISSFMLLAGKPLTQLFTNNPSAIKGSLIVILLSFVGVPATIGTLVYTAAWQGLGNAKLPFYTTTIGMWLIRVVLGYLLGIVFELGLLGVWMATIADNIFRWLFLKVRYHRYIQKM
ncbi:Sodium:solute antiporter [Streptococcus agalactiae]|nr:Sodium:solute antiporter [Streptococcus agalactiae]EJZ03193.1 MATE efflux family protein [Streptococcus agalactiae STIR-CD-17]EPU05279.1 sodium:solute antiporter [Streptococcus agalactiae STIR-CD-13]EPU05953.1 sodium:solute antiporter [Streptococcus agalactiae STIR-CD-09]EPW88512.1 sodium:solute antiporter [Streptococcus agalactiae STIR-CD-07]CCQ76190.1 MATE efflux family protein [Streptococcus agalactiae SS1219]CCQ78376.1 MATE efflux family protein [Streptococcus agalactiae LADL-90-503]